MAILKIKLMLQHSRDRQGDKIAYRAMYSLWCSKKMLIYSKSLKADLSHLHDYPHTSTDYRHNDKHLRLVMPLTALCCTRQRSKGSAVRALTDGPTARRKDIISLASRSIINTYLCLICNNRLHVPCERSLKEVNLQGHTKHLYRKPLKISQES